MQSMIEHAICSSFRRKPESSALENVIPLPTYRSKNKGFTLIELIIFIVVGAIILPVSFVTFTSAMKYFSTPDYYVKARFFAEERMEAITSNTYAGVGITSGMVPDGSPETGFQRSLNICYVLSSAPNQCASDQATDSYYKKVALSITMPDGSAYDVSTIVTRRPKS